MRLSNDNNHSFVIKIWLEETVEEAGRAKWRGHVTHVTSGERRYVERITDITGFLIRHMETMGIRFGMLGRLAQFWRRATSHRLKRDRPR